MTMATKNPESKQQQQQNKVVLYEAERWFLQRDYSKTLQLCHRTLWLHNNNNKKKKKRQRQEEETFHINKNSNHNNNNIIILSWGCSSSSSSSSLSSLSSSCALVSLLLQDDDGDDDHDDDDKSKTTTKTNGKRKKSNHPFQLAVQLADDDDDDDDDDKLLDSLAVLALQSWHELASREEKKGPQQQQKWKYLRPVLQLYNITTTTTTSTTTESSHYVFHAMPIHVFVIWIQFWSVQPGYDIQALLWNWEFLCHYYFHTTSLDRHATTGAKKCSSNAIVEEIFVEFISQQLTRLGQPDLAVDLVQSIITIMPHQQKQKQQQQSSSSLLSPGLLLRRIRELHDTDDRQKQQPQIQNNLATAESLLSMIHGKLAPACSSSSPLTVERSSSSSSSSSWPSRKTWEECQQQLQQRIIQQELLLERKQEPRHYSFHNNKHQNHNDDHPSTDARRHATEKEGMVLGGTRSQKIMNETKHPNHKLHAIWSWVRTYLWRYYYDGQQSLYPFLRQSSPKPMNNKNKNEWTLATTTTTVAAVITLWFLIWRHRRRLGRLSRGLLVAVLAPWTELLEALAPTTTANNNNNNIIKK